MNHHGIRLCCRYAFPPNALSLCGPNKIAELSYYTQNGVVDDGTPEILTQFGTLYPYLCFIAGENKKQDPFDPPIVEAYWLGNSYLHNVSPASFIALLSAELDLHRKIMPHEERMLYEKVATGAFPHHAFHVLNVYRRTGHIPDTHTIQTMDACIINWGTVNEIHDDHLLVTTQRLKEKRGQLVWEHAIKRTVTHAGKTDQVVATLTVGDTITYHWGKICTKITAVQQRRLEYYTNVAIQFSNSVETHNYASLHRQT